MWVGSASETNRFTSARLDELPPILTPPDFFGAGFFPNPAPLLGFVLCLGADSRFSMAPCKAHVKAVKRVAQYLYHTKYLGIVFYRDSNQMLVDPLVYENAKHPLSSSDDKESLLKVFGTQTMLWIE